MDFRDVDLELPPPEEEPQRQRYFIAKCRGHVSRMEEAAGRKLTACVATMGCQMNARDSEKLSGILSLAGYRISESEESDLVVYNTCTVRENANHKVWGRLGYFKAYKKTHPWAKVALCGCMMQEPGALRKIKESYPFVDLVFGTHNLYKFAELLCAAFEQDGMVVDVWEEGGRIVEDLPARRKYPFKSGVNIMFGCDNFCSYCIVPYVRGRERSRSPKDIIEEVRRLAADGVVEVMLLGQNVNSYGKGLEEEATFAGLLAEIEKIDGIERIRFMTSHPKDLSGDLIRAMAGSRKICRHLHLPLQSGSSRILKAMNRHYNKEQYLSLVQKIRREIPDIALTTDIIVGFPGETEEDFLETMDVVEQAGFESAFTFLYSKRAGTAAASMDGQVPQDVAKARFDRLLSKVQEVSARRAEALTGQVLPVLAEEVNGRDQSLLTGRLSNNFIVHFPGSAGDIGKIVPVRLTECKGFYFYGEKACTHT